MTKSKKYKKPKKQSELRDQIYAHLFCSTRFASGKRATARIGRQKILSANRGKALGILRSCRRARDEIGDEWLSQVLFHFEDPESMLNKLSALPTSTRSKIRHLRVSGQPLMLSFEDDDVYYRTAQAIKLLPGLKLDVLTVLGDKTPAISYQTLDMLVRHGDAWKELRFISHNSELLGYKDDMLSFGPSDPMEDMYLRQPQPSNWQHALEQRDGVKSKPSVKIYRSKNTSTPCAVLHADKCTAFSQTFAADEDARTYGRAEDKTLMRTAEREKELLVIVRRGQDIDYAEKNPSPYLPVGDIREDFNCSTWTEIKAKQDALFKDVQDGDPFDDMSDDDDEEEPGLVDTYTAVDQYTWPLYHSIRDQ